MTTANERSAAEERLLDAALQQLLAERGADAAQPARRGSSWWAAALVLFGVAVTATSMWLARLPQATAQEPAPLPAEVRASSKAAIEALPATTENLFVELEDPRDITAVRRLRSLRRLVANHKYIGLIQTREVHELWSKPPADWLSFVQELPLLENLTLSHEMQLSPELLTPLASQPSLRELTIAGKSLELDPLIGALRAIGTLRSLHLRGARLNVEVMRRLQTVPLHELELANSLEFDAAAFRELVTMPKLRRLAFRGLGNTALGHLDAPLSRPGNLQLAGLRELPNLTALSFDGCDLRDEDLLALPDTLQELRVYRHELTTAGLANLARFGSLRTLSVGLERNHVTLFAHESPEELQAAADALVAAIDKLRLGELGVHGALSTALVSAIVRQPDLVTLRLSAIRLSGIGPLANVRTLQSLTLSENGQPGDLQLDDLKPFTVHPSLRSVHVHVYDLDPAAVRERFPQRAHVTVDCWKTVPKTR